MPNFTKEQDTINSIIQNHSYTHNDPELFMQIMRCLRDEDLEIGIRYEDSIIGASYKNSVYIFYVVRRAGNSQIKFKNLNDYFDINNDNIQDFCNKALSSLSYIRSHENMFHTRNQVNDLDNEEDTTEDIHVDQIIEEFSMLDRNYACWRRLREKVQRAIEIPFDPENAFDNKLYLYTLNLKVLVWLDSFIQNFNAITCRDKTILKLRIFEDITLREIGNRYGITTERTRQIEKKSISRIIGSIKRGVPENEINKLKSIFCNVDDVVFGQYIFDISKNKYLYDILKKLLNDNDLVTSVDEYCVNCASVYGVGLPCSDVIIENALEEYDDCFNLNEASSESGRFTKSELKSYIKRSDKYSLDKSGHNGIRHTNHDFEDEILSKLLNCENARFLSNEDFDSIADWTHGYSHDSSHNHDMVYITNEGNEIECDSQAENMILCYLEEKDLVLNCGGQNLEISYATAFRNNASYYPDIIALTRDHHIAVIEIKSINAMSYHINIQKYKALQEYCESKGYEYMMIDPQNDYMTLEEFSEMPVDQWLIDKFETFNEMRESNSDIVYHISKETCESLYQEYISEVDYDVANRTEFKKMFQSCIVFYDWYNMSKYDVNCFSEPVYYDQELDEIIDLQGRDIESVDE